MSFPCKLLDAFWHATTVKRYHAILETGYILPEPKINDDERWGTGMGSSHYPFVRKIGGVSIFDFFGFEPDQYSEKFPASSWRSFVPTQRNWNRAVWIKLSPEKMPGKFLNGLELRKIQWDQEALKNMLMPRIECAHIGPIPIKSFVQILLYDQEQGFREINKPADI
jgi:hypothetical protein